MGYAIPVTIQMADMTCSECGIQYAVPELWRREKQRNGGNGHCPNGHGWAYRETDAQRLQKKLDEALRTNTALAERARQAEAAAQKAVTERARLIRRAKAGVCPCCNRTFQNLARHMQTKHKDAA